MEAGNYISQSTGFILLDPIRINGSSQCEERGFIARCIVGTGKNPFTRAPMTMQELNEIKTDEETQTAINSLMTNFLIEHKDHPEYEDIKKAIEDERYQPGMINTENKEPEHGVPLNATADDLIAIQDAMQQLNRQAGLNATPEDWELVRDIPPQLQAEVLAAFQDAPTLRQGYIDGMRTIEDSQSLNRFSRNTFFAEQQRFHDELAPIAANGLGFDFNSNVGHSPLSQVGIFQRNPVQNPALRQYFQSHANSLQNTVQHLNDAGNRNPQRGPTFY